MSKYNPSESIKAQREYCEREDAPHFAPCSGICWNCHKNIYEPIDRESILFGEKKVYTTGITVEEASTSLITGCPHCNRSYFD